MSDRKNSSAQLRISLEQLLRHQKQTSMALPQILEGLKLRREDKAVLLNEIRKMQDEGLLVKTERGRFGLPDRLGLITGVLQGNRRGFAFLRPDRQAEDIFISAGNLNDAAHGDKVMVRVDEKKRGRRRREGTVIGILKRGRNRLIGTLQKEKKRYYVIPDDQRFPGVISVEKHKLEKAQSGDKVIVEIEKWSQGNKLARGNVAELLGPTGSYLAEKLAFKHRFDLPGDFPAQVMQEIENLPQEEDIKIIASEQGREDLRDLKMVTIDDRTARDFDDAVSLENLPDGGHRLGVHIADVSHYVREGKPLDREAFKRGTSIYLVERAIHMLPPALSESLCSLQAEKDRLAVSAIMDIDSDGNLLSARFFPSLIRVTERLTYQQVEAYFNGESGEEKFKDESLPLTIDQMSQLAEILRRKRFQRGALDLDLPEARIELDENEVPVSVEKRAMGRSESLIEEFMIYCNEAVASYLAAKKIPCIYRIHTIPTEDKLTMLRETLSLMGISAVSGMKNLKPKHLKELLEKTRGERNEKLVRYLVLRSLPQAVYSASNEGHFGLSSSYYCHFTSPIRRYPDLVVHRILKKKLLPGGLTAERIKRLKTRLPEIALHSSERERAAVDAERASIEIKKAEYMERKIGEVYDGIINGVTNFGLFVELDNTIEGMIPVSELDDDYYIYNEKAASLVGERTRKTYRLGDSIRIQVTRVNREEGKITFAEDKKTEIS